MNSIRTIGLALVLLATVQPASAIESLGYETLKDHNGVEIRQYEAHLLASVRVSGGFKNASYSAFRPLFNFISGDNSEATEIAMTAPVLQRPDNAENTWVVSFVMPRSFDLSTLLRPPPTLLMWLLIPQPRSQRSSTEAAGVVSCTKNMRTSF